MRNADAHSKRTTPRCVKNVIFCGRLRRILLKRYAGDLLLGVSVACVVSSAAREKYSWWAVGNSVA
ncbi:hypothetical protein CDES_14340 (plasmid) [Corynebacterium deserti GIMN1.010]|uniref:Uncharacterized protein n=1 Tax=Corynebacterium deserti GIMN1.010 TaxID=931089 RepID=A0A0M3QAE9_9CORY|nr:hypothetical protein CDES_14340 [Corynebacterium deserti GIMN1.010]